MRELGMLSEADYKTARAEPVRVPPATIVAQPAAYFTDYVRLELEQRWGDVTENLGARVYTSLDPVLQRFAETAVVRGLDRLETAVAATRDARSRPGACRPRWWRSIRPPGRSALSSADATTRSASTTAPLLARRQPGSAFKPFVYLAALRAHGGPPALTAASIVDDSPITLTVGNDTWSSAQLRRSLRGPGDRAPRARAVAQRRHGTGGARRSVCRP